MIIGAAAAVILLTACSVGTSSRSTAEQNVQFPVQEAADGQRDVMDAELIGNLVVDGDCMRLEADHGVSYLVVWPPGFALDTESDDVVVRDDAGEIVIHEGDNVRLDGGEPPNATELEGCPGPVWFVGKTVGAFDATSTTPTAGVPAREELGGFTINRLNTEYQDRSGASIVRLARSVTADEVAMLVSDSATPEPCTTPLTFENQYCHPSLELFIVIAEGVWETRDIPSRGLGRYMAVVWDLSEDDHLGQLQTITSCNGARFKSLLDDATIPYEEPASGC